MLFISVSVIESNILLTTDVIGKEYKQQKNGKFCNIYWFLTRGK